MNHLSLNTVFSLFLCCVGLAENGSPVKISISPDVTRSIEGVSELDRNAYFAVADPGPGIAKRLKTGERLSDLFEKNGARLGRNLGPIAQFTKYTKVAREDAKRPGFTDVDFLKSFFESLQNQQHEDLQHVFRTNFDVAAHGKPGAFPDFIGKFQTKQSVGHKAGVIPENLDAAAELSAYIFKYGYSDLTRPRFYEPINEPHWSFFKHPKLAEWHLKTHAAMKSVCPEVQVGGMCMSVSYFARDGYSSWNSLKSFIDNTGAKLDFYSFHSYDYYSDLEAGNNETTITSGLPLEGSLDLVNSYGRIAYGKSATPIVISEHGGYGSNAKGFKSSYDGESLAYKAITKAPKELVKEGFEGELQRRSVPQWIHLSSIIANTLTFMDHPHSVKKAVPFLLANTENWDPKYYASIYTPEGYEKGAPLRTSYLHNFYKLMRGISGHRVAVKNPDSDLQVRSFVDDSTVFTVINNLAATPHTVSIEGISPDAKNSLRSLSRGSSMIPSYSEQTLEKLQDLTLAGRDCIVLVSEVPTPIKASSTLEEKVFYADVITQHITAEKASAQFKISIPSASESTSSQLRIGFNRPEGADYKISVVLNGKSISAPTIDSTSRYHHAGKGFSTTRLIDIPQDHLQKENVIDVTFPDGKPGTIGSVVIRASFSNSPQSSPAK